MLVLIFLLSFKNDENDGIPLPPLKKTPFILFSVADFIPKLLPNECPVSVMLYSGNAFFILASLRVALLNLSVEP